jgi:membrane protein implicated in regulation of membrane protease activity
MTQGFWAYYTIIGLALMGLEVIISGFFLLPIGLGFLLSAVFSLFIEDRSVMHFVNAICILVCVGVVRKYFKKSSPAQANPTEDLVGREVSLETDLTPSGKAYGKIFGESWVVVSEDTTASYKQSEQAVIVAIDGNKLIVRKK